MDTRQRRFDGMVPFRKLTVPFAEIRNGPERGRGLKYAKTSQVPMYSYAIIALSFWFSAANKASL